MVIRDRITLGAIAGFIGSLPAVGLNYIAVQMGLSKYYSFQISAGPFLNKESTATLAGLIFGGIIWQTAAAFLGVLLVYIFSLTGKDFWWLKGPLASVVFMYIAIYGFFFNFGGSRIVPWDLPTNFSVLIGNLLYGLLTGYLLIRWGEKVFTE